MWHWSSQMERTKQISTFSKQCNYQTLFPSHNSSDAVWWQWKQNCNNLLIKIFFFFFVLLDPHCSKTDWGSLALLVSIHLNGVNGVTGVHPIIQPVLESMALFCITVMSLWDDELDEVVQRGYVDQNSFVLLLFVLECFFCVCTPDSQSFDSPVKENKLNIFKSE